VTQTSADMWLDRSWWINGPVWPSQCRDLSDGRSTRPQLVTSHAAAFWLFTSHTFVCRIDWKNLFRAKE